MCDDPWQIETLADEDEFGMTVNVVVIVLSHPAAFGICETYTPDVFCRLPSGNV